MLIDYLTCQQKEQAFTVDTNVDVSNGLSHTNDVLAHATDKMHFQERWPTICC